MDDNRNTPEKPNYDSDNRNTKEKPTYDSKAGSKPTYDSKAGSKPTFDSEAGSICPICLGEYSSSGSHRIISLKCGHLFGGECIERWASLYKKNYCPTCCVPFKKSQFRIIYAPRVISYEEKGMIEKYVKENEARRALEKEVMHLKTQIEIIKASNVKNESNIKTKESDRLHVNFLRYCKIHFFPNESKIVFDSINQVLLISCLKDGKFGIFKYSIDDFSINSFMPLGKVRAMRMSPFGDGLILVGHDCRVSLVNVYSELPVVSLACEYEVTAVSFCRESRDQVFVGDISGNLYRMNLVKCEMERHKICKENIHSIVENGKRIFIGSVLGIYTNDYAIHAPIDAPIHAPFNDAPFVKEDLIEGAICTGLTIEKENILAIFRGGGYSTHVLVMGERNFQFDPDAKQYWRHEDAFFNGHIFIIDDSKDRVKVFDRTTLQMVYSYGFKEKIVGISGDSNILSVLTRRGVYLYDSKG